MMTCFSTASRSGGEEGEGMNMRRKLEMDQQRSGLEPKRKNCQQDP
jgi:hypothetical protein